MRSIVCFLLLTAALCGCGVEWFPTQSTTPAVSVTTTSLAGGTVGTAYNQTLAATGGTAPYSWTLASGSPPPAGLTLDTSGTITGTPTTAGTSTFTVQAADSSTPALTATQSLTITIS